MEHRTEAKSAGVAAWSRINESNAAGRVIRTAGRSARSSGSTSAASQRRATTTRPPTESAARENEIAATCDAEDAGSTTSPATSSAAAAALATRAAKLACECVTPLGRPVLPEVKKMKASCCGGGTVSERGAAADHSARRPSPSPCQMTPCGRRAAAERSTSSRRSAAATSIDAPAVSRA